MLRDAGVVDAGGAGSSRSSAARGPRSRRGAAGARGDAAPLPLEAIHLELSRFRYCTSFFVEGDGPIPTPSSASSAPSATPSSSSAGPVRSRCTSTPTTRPGAHPATAVGVVEGWTSRTCTSRRRSASSGSPARRDAADRRGRGQRGGGKRTCSRASARAAGRGRADDESTYGRARRGDRGVNANEVIVLPNNRNVVLAAEQAAASVAKRPGCRAHRDDSGGSRCARFLRSGPLGRGQREGDGRGCVLVRTGRGRAHRARPRSAASRSRRGSSSGSSTASRSRRARCWTRSPARCWNACSTAAPTSSRSSSARDGPGGRARAEIESAHPELEVEVHDGGQPHYPLLFAAE